MIAFAAQGRGTNLLEVSQQGRITRHTARAHQRLVFPGPRALALVFGVAGQRRHQRALAAIRAQPHVDVVQATGRSHRRQQRHHLLRQSREPAAAFQWTRAIAGLGLGWMRIQEHQVEIGTETQLQPTQAAVADDGEASAGHFAMCAGHVGTRHFKHRHHHRVG
ncbi:hypothetical protein D3C81_1423820 [compost metagenome]